MGIEIGPALGMSMKMMIIRVMGYPNISRYKHVNNKDKAAIQQ